MSAYWNDRGRRAQDECHVTVARCDNFFLDVGLLWHGQSAITAITPFARTPIRMCVL
jgi:hypothetical protein